jgi:hypothetical protein
MNAWKQTAAAAIVNHAAPAPTVPVATVTVAQLNAAKQVFSQRGQSRNAETCADMAVKLARYGSFVSAKQADYAAKLCEWAGTESIHHPANVPAAAPQKPVVTFPAYQPPVAAPAASCPNLSALVALDGFARFTVGKLQLTLKNDGSLIWVKWDGRIAGRIQNGTYIESRRYLAAYALSQARAELERVEADPKAAAAADGILTGRCSCCSRPLTDPTSIALGIGPICILKF